MKNEDDHDHAHDESRRAAERADDDNRAIARLLCRPFDPRPRIVEEPR